MGIRKRFRYLSLGLTPALFFSFRLLSLAQSTTTIQGTVADSSGAAVPGATVAIRNQGTGEQRSTITDGTGAYVAPALPLGKYRIEVSAGGFQTAVVNDVPAAVGSTMVQNLTLSVASSSQTVEIQASAPVIDASGTALGQVINQQMVQEVPLNGRHFVDLGLLIPGSVTPPQSGFLTAPLRGQGSFAFNTAGNREDTVNFMINGINLNDMAQNQITFQPSINTVAEFKVDNSTYSPEYGRNSGAIVNIATRSGSNEIHGEVFEFLRNNALDARNYFNVKPIPQSPFKRNQYGASAGGPIWRDHTFFFLSYEGLRQRQGLTINQTVLTDAQRSQALSIGNPTVGKLLGLIPAANLGGAKLVGSATAPVDIDQGTANISHSFGPSDRLNVYYAFQRDLRQEPTLQGDNIPGFGDIRHSHRQIMTVNETHVFGPSAVNEFRAGYNRISITFLPKNALDPAAFGINTGVSGPVGLPQMAVTSIGLNFGGPSGFPQGRGDYTGVMSDTFSLVRGRHSLRMGGEVRRANNDNFAQTPGTFAFNTVDDFINGRAATFTANASTNPSRIYALAIGGFVQDSWRVSKSLLLDLGLRYDWNGTPVEAQNRFVQFDPASAQLVRVGSGVFGKAYKQNALNFQPRVGFAWNAFGSDRTVLRGAYAIQTDQPIFNLVSPLASNPPFATPVSFNGGGTAGFVGFDAYGAGSAASTLSPVAVNRDFGNAYMQSWNLNIQQQLSSSMALMVSYVGNKGSDLRIERNLNQLIAGTSVRPYPAISANSAISPGVRLGTIGYYDSAGNSSYNALWLTVTKRISKGLQFNSSYTFSKSIDDNSLNTQGIGVQDSSNIRGDRGLSDFDARHRFVMSGLYTLPFKGNRLIEGWEFSTITQLQTGNPVNIITSSAGYTGLATVRPNVLGTVPILFAPAGNGNIQYFPSAACTTADPACIFQIGTTLGNLGRNVVIGPGFEDVDFSVIKNTRFGERLTMQFRGDVFDVLNNANFGQPNRVVSTAAGNTFGQITNTRFGVGDSGSSRQIQLALKFLF